MLIFYSPTISRKLAVYIVVESNFFSFLFESDGVTAILRNFVVFLEKLYETHFTFT
jgi:hypothetical protein